jgi:hypothetical protein
MGTAPTSKLRFINSDQLASHCPDFTTKELMPSMIGVAAARVLRIALLADKLHSLLPNA